MPLRSSDTVPAAPGSRRRIELVAHNGSLAPARVPAPLALQQQRQRSRRAAFVGFGVGLLVLVAAAAELLI